LAVALAEMVIGGDIGADVDIKKIMGEALREDVALFSESNTRWIVEVENRSEVEKILNSNKIPFTYLGKVDGKNLRISLGNKVLIDKGVEEVRRLWHEPLWHYMG
ncbi:MAG TPA: phosphoribosylformylglycinamidine synthase II, partial [Thermoplasmatales archaeon]|nr:phosphoribosylformylglycinamidine synthase II [Thermoplasmatales archaeon]